MGSGAGSPFNQATRLFQHAARFGESRHAAKVKGRADAGIYSFNTMHAYINAFGNFLKYARAEFGVRLAIGSSPRHLLVGVLKQGAAIAGIGIVVGVLGGLLIVRLVGGFIEEVTMPGVMPVVGAALVLAVAAVLASVVPAARAARINVHEALRSE